MTSRRDAVFIRSSIQRRSVDREKYVFFVEAALLYGASLKRGVFAEKTASKCSQTRVNPLRSPREQLSPGAKVPVLFGFT